MEARQADSRLGRAIDEEERVCYRVCVQETITIRPTIPKAELIKKSGGNLNRWINGLIDQAVGNLQLNRLCENSEMAFWKNEKRVLGPLAAKENAPYRNCGGRFSRVAGWRGVFAQSGNEADFPGNLPPRYLGGYQFTTSS